MYQYQLNLRSPLQNKQEKTMALKRSNLEQIPQRNKDLAFGYVKENEKSNKWTIPSMIKYLCLIYLNQNRDEFDPKNTNEKIKIDGLTITALGTNTIATYLRNVVSEGCHIWRFKCGSKSDWTIGDKIGIISNHAPIALDHYFQQFGVQSYGFAVAGKLIGGSAYGRRCEIDDVIEMSVNFNDLTLSYKINDCDYGKAFDIEAGEYRATISLFAPIWSHPNSCYTLISYQHIH